MYRLKEPHLPRNWRIIGGMGFVGGLLFAVSVVWSGQGAPADVPKDHWAYSAVNELFQNGLLDGYPSEGALTLDRNAVYDQEALTNDFARWRKLGLAGGYPDGLSRPAEPSRYLFAVIAHTAYVNVKSMADESRGSKQLEAQFSMDLVPEIPKIVRAMSMVAPELERMGGDTHAMILDLNRIWPKFAPLFRG